MQHRTLTASNRVGAVVDQRGESDRVDRDQGSRIGRRATVHSGTHRPSRHRCRMIRFGAHC